MTTTAYNLPLGPAYLVEALRTIEASRWLMFKVKLFGEQLMSTDKGMSVTLYRYKGKSYLTDFKETHNAD